MSNPRFTSYGVGVAAISFIAGVCGFAVAQSNLMPAAVKEVASITLGNNEGVFVQRSTFKIGLGTAKGDPAAQIDKMGAKEMTNGLIVFRSGDKLYLVDGKPADSSPQAMRNFDDVWSQSRLMKSFDDVWQQSPLMR
jgi:hypothetical protein